MMGLMQIRQRNQSATNRAARIAKQKTPVVRDTRIGSTTVRMFKNGFVSVQQGRSTVTFSPEEGRQIGAALIAFAESLQA